ncbi:hypothetical protein A4G20_03890 [Pasteurellaceae bacterium RH1A]|nr:hypothetical protein A4G20_03890 [Pasteurellaceae bacterium RH1A]
MSQALMNEFSLLCRLFGNLFYRQPTDPILAGTFAWLKAGNLAQHWPLATDSQSEKVLEHLAQGAEPQALEAAYQALFGQAGSVDSRLSSYGGELDAFIDFRSQRGMPALEEADHVALLLLTASWIEDNLDSLSAQQDFFAHFLLPLMGKFLGKVEAFDMGFYKALAQLTRDALAAMADELEETTETI